MTKAKDFESLFSFFGSFVPLSNSEKETLIPCLSKKNFQKMEFVLRASEPTKFLYFVEKGIVRAYYQKEEKEITTWFTFANDFAASFGPLVRKSPSEEFLQTMTPTTLIQIDYHAFKSISLSSKSLSLLFVSLFEEAYTKLENRLTFIQHSSAKVRLEELVKHEPHILETIPKVLVASYLAITPETLSRLIQQTFRNK